MESEENLSQKSNLDNSMLSSAGGSDADEDSGPEERDLKQMDRPELLEKIKTIWVKKKKFSDKLIELSKQIEAKKQQIRDTKQKMTIESNQLNVIGADIFRIENKIKELT